MKSIDVVVPCYNYGKYLACCVSSVLDQEEVSVRVLIIDDASSDDTAEIAEGLAAKDSRIAFRRHSVNCGNIATYNEGIAWANADYFMILSADDWLVPGALARAVTVFEQCPDVIFVHGRAALARNGEAAPVIPFQSRRVPYHVETGQAFIEAACRDSSQNHVWTPTAILRTSVQKEVGGYCKDLPHAGDLHLWLRVACRGAIGKIEAIQAVYRTHASNMHYSYPKLKNLKQHLLAFETVFHEYGERIADRERLRREYQRGLAMEALRLAQHELIENLPDSTHECISFALEVCSDIRKTLQWWQFQMLSLMGQRTASTIKALLLPSLRAMRQGRKVCRILVSAPD